MINRKKREGEEGGKNKGARKRRRASIRSRERGLGIGSGRYGGNLPRQSMPRNWEFYNIFGSEPVDGRTTVKGGGAIGEGGCKRARGAASGEDGYALFEGCSAPDEKCTRLKFTATKRAKAIWKHTKL